MKPKSPIVAETRLQAFARGCTMIAPFVGLFFWFIAEPDLSIIMLIIGAIYHSNKESKFCQVMTSLITMWVVVLFIVGMIIGAVQTLGVPIQ